MPLLPVYPKYHYSVLILLTSLFALWLVLPLISQAQNNDFCTTITQIPTTECEGLVALYATMDGPHWGVNWFSTRQPCNWTGIHCTNGHVTTISWNGDYVTETRSRVRGNIPAEIGNLIYLEHLSFELAQVQSLPPEIGKLQKLRRLELTVNELTSLPIEIGQLKNLERLLLGYNQLKTVPHTLGELTNLTELQLYNNPLVAIPAEMGQLKRIKTLLLWSNQISFIPPELGQLRTLQILAMGYNPLKGSIPPELGNLINLQEFDISNSLLSGPMPLELLNLAQLNSLSTYNTQLCQPDEPEFQKWLKNINSVSLNNLSCNVVQLIPETGGTITSTDGRVTLEIPPHALTQSTIITYRYRYREPVSGLASLDYFFDLEAQQSGANLLQQFRLPITIKISGTKLNEAQLYHLEKATWQPITLTYHTTDTLIGQTSLTGRFAVLAPKTQIYIPIIVRQP